MAVATADPSTAPATVTATAYEPATRGASPTVVGTALAVVADLMVFAALIAAYYGLRASSFQWPPRGLSQPRYLATVITMTVVMGVASAQWVAYASRRGDRRNTLVALALTALFAVMIAAAEWAIFGKTTFGLRSHAYGTMHHTLIGFHLLNMVVVLALVGAAFAQGLGRPADDRRPGPFAALALFWHATAAMWLVIFYVLFLAS